MKTTTQQHSSMFKKLFALWAMSTCTLATTAYGQAIVEGFEDVSALPLDGWTMINASFPAGSTQWEAALGAFDSHTGDPLGYISSDYSAAISGMGFTLSNWLLTPTRTFNNGDVITFYTRTTSNPAAFADNLQVRLSTNGASADVGIGAMSVGDFTTVLLDINPTYSLTVYPGDWTQYTITLSGLSGATSGRIAFRHFIADTDNDGDVVGIDDFVYTPAGSSNDPDLSVESFEAAYALIPASQVVALPLTAEVANLGAAAANNAVLTVNVYVGPNFTTPAQTFTSPATNIGTGASTVLSVGSYTPSGIGEYVIEYLIDAANDNNPANDTAYYNFEVTDDEYARDLFAAFPTWGETPGTSGRIGALFDIHTTAVMESAWILTEGQAAGDQTRVYIYNTSAGVPNAIIGQSSVYTFSGAGTLASTIPVQNLSAGPLTLNPGTYFVAIEQPANASQYMDLYASPFYFNLNTVFLNSNNGAFVTAESEGLFLTPAIHPILGDGSCSITANISNTMAACGIADGTASVTPTSGATPYTYLWNNGQTTATATGLAAATYTATVTDANNCTVVLSTTVSGATGISTNIAATNATCSGAGDDGTATATPTSGTAPYNYLWSNSQTTATATGLLPGNYAVTVTDVNGCTATNSVSVNTPTPPALNAFPTSTPCGVSDGAVSLTVTGGIAPYAYLWSNGQTTADISGLAAGTYTVTVTDNGNCTATTTATVVVNGSVIVLGYSSSPATCAAADGSALLEVTNATAPYTIQWSNGQTGLIGTGLAAGTYPVTVTDANNCVASTTVSVGFIVVTLDVDAVITNNRCDAATPVGAIDLSVNSGDAPYNFLWNDGNTNQDRTNLAAGNYRVTVTDANGCQGTLLAEVETDNAGITVSSVITPAACNNSIGAINLTVNSGTAPYTFHWENGKTTEDITGLDCDNYAVTVSDSKGCQSVYHLQVGSVDGANATAAITNVGCFGGSNGAINMTVTGGVGVLSYFWQDFGGGIDEDRTNLSEGYYEVKIVDLGFFPACENHFEFYVGQAEQLQASIEPHIVTCNGGSDGSATVTVSGGNAPYSYTWSNSSSAQNLAGVQAGSYTLTIHDASNCSTQLSTQISQPSAITLTTASTTQSPNQSDGSATVSAQGGVAPYTYLWNNGATTAGTAGLVRGNYTVTVTDGLGCAVTATVFVDGPVGVASLSTAIDDVRLFPNPTSDQATLEVSLSKTTDLQVSILHATGQLIQTINENAAQMHQIQLYLGDLPAGMYFVQIRAGEAIITRKLTRE